MGRYGIETSGGLVAPHQAGESLVGLRRKTAIGSTRLLASGFLLAVMGCSDASTPGGLASGPSSIEGFCTIPQDQIFQGTSGKDAIPALTDPIFVRVGESGSEYLRDEDRVIGLLFGTDALAVPLNIMWWHEIVNLDVGGLPVSITHCPLTGSSMGFDRGAVDGVEFGVSGLLYQNNLIMYDRTVPESLWPQMLRGARCGDRSGAELEMVPLVEMTWEGWRSMYPDTRVLSSFTRLDADYENNPYGNYDQPNNPTVLFPQEVDTRFPPKERALGIPSGAGGIVFPFSLLDEQGPVTVVHLELGGEPLVVFWDRAVQGAMAYRPVAGGQPLTFRVQGGLIIDDETGSVWRMGGGASAGPLAGQSLDPVADAFVAFWFAWPAFYPEIQIWGPA